MKFFHGMPPWHTWILVGLMLLAPDLIAQVLTPVDSLFATDTLTVGQRLVFKPIQWWQHLSYSNSAMNCQFENSCSNFMVESIQKRGVLRGLVVGTDRIVRCNPAARHYHSQIPGARIHFDGRLFEPVDWQPEYKSSKSPTLAVILSLVPGLGRSYAGHPWDGVFSFLLVSGFAYNTYAHHQADHPVMTAVSGGFTLLFWSADIYGAYRTARFAPPVQSAGRF